MQLPELGEPHTCPRRMTELGPWKHEAGLDAWATGRGLVGVQGENPSCSFCGSLHPDTFMRWARDGGALTPTDKSYKVYVTCPYPNPRYGEVSTGEYENGSGTKVPYTSVFGDQAKFYFQHLSRQQRIEFIELYNAKSLSLPHGGFYVLPFFARPAPTSGAQDG